jgi:hypothetical protein
MSTDRMTPYEKNQRSLARAFGRDAQQYIDLTARWNRAGEKYIDVAYDRARRAAHCAAESIDACERRTRPRRRKGSHDARSRA